MIYKIILFLFSVLISINLSCFASESNPLELKQNGLIAGQEKETGSDTPCVKDSDCWCHIFTGAEFRPGKDQSKCCVPGDENRYFCPKMNHCANCAYD